MADYSLSFAGLENAVSEMNSISKQIEGFLNDLQTGTMKSILEWESGARDLFDQQRQVWEQGANDMVTQAVNAQSALNQIRDHYADGENGGVKIWQPR